MLVVLREFEGSAVEEGFVDKRNFVNLCGQWSGGVFFSPFYFHFFFLKRGERVSNTPLWKNLKAFSEGLFFCLFRYLILSCLSGLFCFISRKIVQCFCGLPFPCCLLFHFMPKIFFGVPFVAANYPFLQCNVFCNPQ